MGDVLPPALNLPMQATDLTVLEHDKLLIVTFKLPSTTTEGMLIRHAPEIDLRIGPAPDNPNDFKGWAAHAKRVTTTEPHADTLATQWVNQKVAVSVRLLNDRGKDAGWAPFVYLTVVPPLEVPKSLSAAPQPAGVHLTWVSSAPKFRVYRRTPSTIGFEQIATAEKPEYDDAVDFDKEYSYYVQAIAPAGDATAESDKTEPVKIVPKDIFPPAAPTGLQYILGGKTIELTWLRNSEPDLAGYRVYRAFENNNFERISETQPATSYSDRNIAAGKNYRYAVTAIDRSNNESKMSEPVTVTAP